jgi:hypothetical protein
MSKNEKAPTGPTGPIGPICNINPEKNLSPDQINIKAIENKAEKDAAAKKIDEWSEGIFNDLVKYLEGKGIKTFQICIWHEGSAMPMLFAYGNRYNAALCAVNAARKFKSEIMSDLEF